MPLTKYYDYKSKTKDQLIKDIIGLKDYQGRFERIAENAKDMIYRMSLPDGQYQYVSPASFSIFGYKPEEIYKDPMLINKSIHPDFKEYFKNELENLLHDNMPPEYEYKIIDKTGNERWLNQRNVLVKDDNGKIIAIEGIVSDINERKEMELKLKEKNEELSRSNKELEQFAYVASHDLQEPLRKVKNFTELFAIKYAGNLDKKADQYIKYITSGTERMQNLILDLLSFSRVATRGKEFKKEDMGEVLQQAILDLQMVIEESKAEIIYDKLPVLKIDSSQIAQVFQNLISNSLKFRGKQKPVVKIKKIDKGNYWQFAVSDNGIGMDMKYADRIFEVFQRLHTKEEYKGTGIGLAICKKIIERHKGKIWVESEPNKGATFYFTLPKKD